jgi:mevalonate kinase
MEYVRIKSDTLKQIIDVSERRREILEKSFNAISKIIGETGMPKQKFKLIGKLTKLINNMEDYEDVLSVLSPEMLGEIKELIKKEDYESAS